jgi:hypothetical protein
MSQLKVGDEVKHIKHKHWGKGRIERFSKSGMMVEIRWQGSGTMYGSFWNRCKVESITKVT